MRSSMGVVLLTLLAMAAAPAQGVAGNPADERPSASGKQEGLAADAQSDEQVLLLLEDLFREDTIIDASYRALKGAIAAKGQAENERRAEELRLAEPGRLAQEHPRLEHVPHEAKEERLSLRASYALGKGLTVRTEDRTFQASLRNQLQVRYTFTRHHDRGADDASSFRVRRMKSALAGYAFFPTLFYHFQVSFADKTQLDDAFVHWKPRSYFGLRVGQFIVPFNRQRLASSGAQQFVDRASTDEFFALGRDQGITVTGSGFGPANDQLAWSLGVFNGNGANWSANENTGHLGAARLLYMPLGRFNYYVESDVDNSRTPFFGIGGAYAYNSQADAAKKHTAGILQPDRWGDFFGKSLGKFDIAQAAADAHFKYRGLSLLCDYYWAQARPASAPSKTAQGYDFQGGYFLIPKRLEVAFRYAFTDRDIGSKTGLRELGGALGYFFSKHNLKLQADVRDVEDDAPKRRKADVVEYRTQLQMIF